VACATWAVASGTYDLDVTPVDPNDRSDADRLEDPQALERFVASRVLYRTFGRVGCGSRCSRSLLSTVWVHSRHSSGTLPTTTTTIILVSFERFFGSTSS